MSRSRSARACGVAALRLGCWAAFAAAAYGCGETGGPGVPPVVFGMTGPVQEAYGANARKGAELAVREINAAGGIDGRTLELRVKDDQASPERAIAMATELLRDPAVVAVAGPVNSKTTIAAGPIYDQGLPAVASSATSPLISQLGDWVFRVASSDSANAIELARRARAMSRRIAVLYANDAYGQGLSEKFRKSLEDAGVRVVESDPYLESMQDFRPYLIRMKQKGVDLVFVAGLEQAAARIITQGGEVGLESRFLGGDGIEGLVAMGPRFDGVITGVLYHPDVSPAARAFANAFHGAYGQEPDSWAASAYDAVKLLARAAQEGGASRPAIRRYLSGVGRPGGSPAFQGATGSIGFDANGDPANKAFPMGVIRDGKVSLLR